MALKNIFKLFAGSLFAFYLLLGTAFPAEAGIISKQQEIEMGRETAMALEAQYGILTRCGLHCAPSAHKTLGTFPQGTVRFSLGWASTEADVDAALAAIRALA